MKSLKQSLIATISYFDFFDYPLTLMEIWKWLYTDDFSRTTRGENANSPQITRRLLADIEEELSEMEEVEGMNGFYFLKDRQEIVTTRLKRYALAQEKFLKARKFAKIFACLPFVKMIAVDNSLAYNNSDKKGDIDLFFICQKNRLWLSRFFIAGLLKILNQRPRPDSKQDALDTNFFISEKKLNLEDLKVADMAHGRLPLAYWLVQMVPLYDQKNYYEKFWQANIWLKELLPNAIFYQTAFRRAVKHNWQQKFFSFVFSLIFNYNFMERLAKKIQLIIMPRNLKSIMNQDGRVMVNENILKFHLEDKRVGYVNKFNKLVS